MAASGQDRLASGLYLVATPLGNARDITLRALDILGAADVLAAEDTRALRRLMEIHGVALNGRRILAYHDHNGPAMRPKILAAIASGKSVAYASEAGTPLVADPGYVLSKAVIDAGYSLTSAPGASAAIAALTLSGLPSDQFTFAGFPPATKAARRSFLEGLASHEATLILYESPKRIAATLAECAAVLGGDRQAAVCRELTKRFEEVTRGTLEELAETFADRSVKGEIVLCVAKSDRRVDVGDLAEELRAAMGDMRLKDAARHLADIHGVSKRELYQLGLKILDEN